MDWSRLLRRGAGQPPPRVFLGTLGVIPRSELRRDLESWFLLASRDLEGTLHDTLREVFAFPPVSSVDAALDTDLVLDIVVAGFSTGAAFYGDLPIVWRPKVKVAARLYYLKSGEVKDLHAVIHRLAWSDFLRVIWHRWWDFGWRPSNFDHDEMEFLLGQACVRLLRKLKRAV